MARRSGIQGEGDKPKKKGLPGFGATPAKPTKSKPEKKPTVKPGFQSTPTTPTKKTTRGQRAITREVYPTLEVKDRQRIVRSGRDKEAARIHADRQRASRALDALAKFQRKHGDDLSGATPQVLKGARVQLRHRSTLGEVPAVVRGSKSGVAGFSSKPRGLHVYGSVDLPKLKREEPKKPKEKKAGLDFNPLHVVKSLAGGVVPDPSGLGGASGANAQRFNPQLHPEQTKELRGAFDGTTWALDQLNRISNAIGGAIEGAKAGGPDNLVTGAVKALKKNDNEVWIRLAHDADLPAWTGLLASIAFDPTTFASFGFKTPAEVARLRGFAKAAKDARALAKAGDEAGAVAKFKAAAAEVEALSSKLEDTYRGIQVGVRNPFTGVVHGTKGRATAKAGRVSAPARDAAKDTKVGRPLNKLAISVSPRVRPVGVDRVDWQAMRNLEREASSVEHRIVRQGRQIGQHVVRVFGGDAKKVRAFVHRVEAGDLAGLPKAEKQLADQIVSYHRSVADEYLKQTGKRLGLLDSLMLAPGDLKKASAAVQDALEAVAKRADRKGAQATRTLDTAQGRAEVGSRTVDGTVSAERTAARYARDSKASEPSLRRAWESVADEQTGARLENVKVFDWPNDALRMSADITLDGKKIGSVSRVYHRRRGVVTKEITQVDEAHQRRGIGKRISQAEERVLGDAGVREVETIPTTDAGKALTDSLGGFAPNGNGFAVGKALDRTPPAAGGHGIRTARAEARRQRAIAEGARDLSKRLSKDVLTADDEEAFANLLRHITENIDAPAAGPIASKVGRAQGQVDRLLKRLSHDPVENYLPREWESSLQASFQRGKRQGPRITTTGESQYELPRHDRRRLADIRAEGGDVWSDNLALLEAKYGVQLGRRLGTLALHKTVRDRFGRFATEADAAAIHDGKLVPYRLADDGRLQKIEKTESIAADELKDTIVLPDWVDKKLSTRLHSHGSWGAYDDLLRAFKTANTIIRPGFFATTFLGNFWQQFLRDLTPADMARSMGALGAIRRTDRAAQGGGARPVSAALKRLFPEETVIDGRRYTFEQLFDEAAEYGAARTGAIFGDPTDISPAREAARRIKGAPKSGAISRRLEAAGQLAEDMDDMTRLVMYRRARLEGMSPQRATEYVYTAMIDYTELTKAERAVLKRVFPFYVYTARNLPIQVKRLVARPGKLANYEKVRSFIADQLGLPDDWETFLTEADQEQIPIPVGRLFKDKQDGLHVPVINPRLPVSDISRPLQMLEGKKGLVRFLQSIAGQAGPAKVPFELALNNRFDYNRPIRTDGYTPEAGTLLKLAGLSKPGLYSAKDKKEYEGVDPTLDYLLRALGGSPASLGLSIGRKLHDPSGVDPTKRGLASFLGGVGVRAPDTLSGPRERLMAEKDRAYSKQKRDEATPPKRGGGKGGEKSIADQDVIDRLKTLLTYVNAQLGDQRAIDDLPRVRHEEMNRRMNPPMSPRYRALERRMNRALRGY